MLVYLLLSWLLGLSACQVQDQAHLTKAGPTAPAGPAKISPAPGTMINCGAQDSAGNLWFGTREGLYRHDGQAFTHFTARDGLGNNSIGSILADQSGKLWIGNNVGVSRYDGQGFTNWLIPSEEGAGFLPFAGAGEADISPADAKRVSSTIQDKSGNLWFGALDGGVYRYDGTSFTHFLPHEVVRCLAEDKNGHIWAGSWSNGGVYRYDGQVFKNFTQQVGLPNGMIACLLADRSGNLWFGTRNAGLCRYDGKSFTSFTE